MRELQHVIERAVILGRGRSLSFAGLAPREAPAPAAEISTRSGAAEIPTLAELKRRERAAVAAALERAGGNSGPGGAAEILGVKPTTLDSKLRALGLRGRRRAQSL